MAAGTFASTAGEAELCERRAELEKRAGPLGPATATVEGARDEPDDAAGGRDEPADDASDGVSDEVIDAGTRATASSSRSTGVVRAAAGRGAIGAIGAPSEGRAPSAREDAFDRDAAGRAALEGV